MTEETVAGLDVIFKFLAQNPELCQKELRTKLAEEMRSIRHENKLKLTEVIKETNLTAPQIIAAEDGSEKAELLTYLKLFLFYKG